MSDNLPAKIPVRPTKKVSPQGDVVPASANPRAPETKVIRPPLSLQGMMVARRHLAQFIRFASRATAKGTAPAL
jgi:hypothetical protein